MAYQPLEDFANFGITSKTGVASIEFWRSVEGETRWEIAEESQRSEQPQGRVADRIRLCESDAC
jgi:hypothetical protein